MLVEGGRGVCLGETLHDAVEAKKCNFARKGVVGHVEMCDDDDDDDDNDEGGGGGEDDDVDEGTVSEHGGAIAMDDVNKPPALPLTCKGT